MTMDNTIFHHSERLFPTLFVTETRGHILLCSMVQFPYFSLVVMHIR